MNPSENYFGIWRNLLLFNAMEIDVRKFSGYLLIGVLIISLLATYGFFSWYASLPPAVALEGEEAAAPSPYAPYVFSMLFFIFFAAAVHATVYIYLLLGANSRAAKVEEVLPEFLGLMSSNIRSGLMPDKALIVSAREEFGPLTQAIEQAGKHSITGMPLDQVMVGMVAHIRSDMLTKTIRLIVEGMHSGGDLADLLEKTALDIRKFRSVRKEVNSIILNYILFIGAAITFGAPLLYGVSTFLVDIMLLIRAKTTSGAQDTLALSGQVGIFKGNLLLTPEAVSMFSIAAILITVFFGCLAMGIMSSGRRVDGLKYFPLLAFIGLAILFGIRAALSSVLSAMMIT